LLLTAIGCADPPAKAGRWFRRYGDTARVGCNSTGRSWTLRCHDNQWIGEVGTCSGQSPVNLLYVTNALWASRYDF